MRQTCGIKNLKWDNSINDYTKESRNRLKDMEIQIELLENVTGDYDHIHKKGTIYDIYREQIKEDGSFVHYGHGGYVADVFPSHTFKIVTSQ